MQVMIDINYNIKMENVYFNLWQTFPNILDELNCNQVSALADENVCRFVHLRMTCTLPQAARVHLQSTQNTKQLLFHQLQEVVVTKSPLFSRTQLGKHQLHQTRAVLF